MRNLPPDLTDHGLKNHLSSVMKALNIKDWSCQKARKKPFGNITFLLLRDGQLFMQHHGQETTHSAMFSKPQERARLMVLNRPVYCAISRNPPDPFLLRCLVKSAEDRQKAKECVQATNT